MAEVEREASTEFAEGRVARPGPEDGTDGSPKGETVTIVVSTGPPKTRSRASSGCLRRGGRRARPGRAARRSASTSSRTQPVGEVVRQNPKAGRDRARGLDRRRCSVSQGAGDRRPCPTSSIQTQASAEAELAAAGFEVSVDRRAERRRRGGARRPTQDPDPGVEAPKGSTVTIVISTGPDVRDRPGRGRAGPGRARARRSRKRASR